MATGRVYLQGGAWAKVGRVAPRAPRIGEDSTRPAVPAGTIRPERLDSWLWIGVPNHGARGATRPTLGAIADSSAAARILDLFSRGFRG